MIANVDNDKLGTSLKTVLGVELPWEAALGLEDVTQQLAKDELLIWWGSGFPVKFLSKSRDQLKFGFTHKGRFVFWRSHRRIRWIDRHNIKKVIFQRFWKDGEAIKIKHQGGSAYLRGITNVPDRMSLSPMTMQILGAGLVSRLPPKSNF